MGAIAECCHDEQGLRWPVSVAPFDVHLISLVNEGEGKALAEKTYELLKNSGVDVLFDDRERVRAGAKFAESDLIGIPKRIILGPKSLERREVEVKERGEEGVHNVPIDSIARYLKAELG